MQYFMQYLPIAFLCLALSAHLLWHLTRAKP